MPGKSIPYSKGFSLHYENSIVPFTEHCLEDPERSFSELKKHKIEEIFFIPEMRGISSEKLSGAAALLKEKGIKCTVIENKTITENNFDFFRKTGKYLNAKLKSTSVLILYEKSNADDAESFIASLLIASKNSEISPEQAVYIATRKDFTPIQNRRVRQFKKHLENQQEKEASAEAGSGNQKHELKDSLSIIKSGFSIRMKLLTLASLIAGGSMLTLILSVTFLFKEHSERMVQEYNLSLARISGLKIASELERIENNSKHFAASIEKKNKNNRTQNTADEFFKINNEVISIGSISSLPNNRIKIRHYQKNTELSKQLGISDANIEKSLYNLQNAIIQSESGGPGYENASSSFNLPVIALILPETKPFYTVVFVETSSILRSFQSAKQSRIFQLYMVNPKGEVLLHSDEDILRSEKNFSDIPIVSGMMENKIMYGSRKYFYNGIEYLGSFNVLKKENLGIVSTAKSDLVYSAVYKIQRQNILILIIILTLSFVLVYFYSRTITSPIMNLMGAVIQLEEGDYDLKIRPESGDEIGILTASFLSAANRLKERNQVKQILGKFVNLNQKITAKLLSASPEHGGNKKECTILYANIRNFSELSETYSADRIVSILNDYYTKMVDCIYKNDGIVDKFIGNSFMAHWGALYKSDNDPVNAVKTALEMRNTLIPYNRRCSELGKPQFRFGCGINTGDAIAGKLGGDQNAEFTVIGGAVNLATKIENLSIDFNTDILITEATKHAVENWFRLVELEPVILSGHKEELKLYAVLGEKSDPGCPSSFDELRKLIHV